MGKQWKQCQTLFFLDPESLQMVNAAMKLKDVQYHYPLSSVQSLSHVRPFATPRIAAHQTSLFIINSRSSLKLMSIESVMPSNHLILCRPLLLPPSIFARIFPFNLFPGSFQMSQFFTSGVQSIEVSALASVLSKNIQD